MGEKIARTDPPVSEAQRRAMWAAAGGHSNLGISKKVGKEFAEADPGGKLPETKKDQTSMSSPTPPPPTTPMGSGSETSLVRDRKDARRAKGMFDVSMPWKKG
jgi:hypothetical protein